MTHRSASLLSLFFVAACATAPPPVSESPRAVPLEATQTLIARADLARAFESVDRDREGIVAQWRELTEIPAPSGQEAKRAALVESLLHQYGLSDVKRDSAGNVMGTRRGAGGGKRVVLDAHLDTVFALDTNITTRIENGHIQAPGVGDNTRNVAALLAAIRAMNDAELQTKGDIVFLFTVEEETTFRGIDQFLADNRSNVDRVVAFDGGYSNFTYGGTGIYWHRYHFIGPGGHTRSDTPPYSATLPLARAIERVYALRLPKSSWINIGMLGGTDVFNSKASDAWMSVDLRSTVQSDLKRLDATIQRIVAEEAGRVGMTTRRDIVSVSEVASVPGHRSSEMVATVEGVFRAFGFDPEINNTAANHTSAALIAGIPAVGIGAAPCEGAHALHENCEIEPIYKGIKRTIALAVALSE